MQLEDFKKNIINVVNTSNLPIDAIYYVFKDIMGEITALYNQTLQQEELKKQQEQKEKEETTTTEEKTQE